MLELRRPFSVRPSHFRSRSLRLVGSVAVVFFSAACSTGNGLQAEAAQGTLVLTPEEAGQVQVLFDRIVVPQAMGQRFLGIAPGTVIAADRNPDPAPSNGNPSGLLRVVTSVVESGSTVVLMSRQARLPEVLQSADFQQVLTPDWSLAKSAGSGALLASSDDAPIVLSLPLSHISVVIAGKPVEVTLTGKIALQPSLDFKPDFDIGFQIRNSTITEFHAIATGALTATLGTTVELAADWDKTLTEEEHEADVAKILEAISEATALDETHHLFSKSLPLPVAYAGVIPVVTDLKFDLDLLCNASIGGSVGFDSTSTTTSTVSAGIKYMNGNWTPVGSESFSSSRTGPNVTVTGSASLGCSLKPMLELRFYGFAGPYIYVEPTFMVAGTVTARCTPATTLPVCTAEAAETIHVKGGAGAQIDFTADILGDDIGLQQDLGELQLFDLNVVSDQTLFGPIDFACPLGTCRGVTCGALGEACCVSELPCLDTLSCQSNTCLPPPPCGGQGQACCLSTSPCSGRLTCQSNTCQAPPPPPCGAQGQACCLSNPPCSGALTCQSNVCQAPPPPPPCGAQGQACCLSNPPCSGAMTCQSNVCQAPPPPPCGAQGQACCLSNPPCSGAMTCQSNVCQAPPPPPCGAQGQACCLSNPPCSGAMTCQSNRCLVCAPNSTRCSSLNPYTPEHCRSDGSGWDLFPECAYLCNPSNGACCGDLGQQCCSIANTSPCASPSVVQCVSAVCRIQ
jgi:hypothetical protein